MLLAASLLVAGLLFRELVTLLVAVLITVIVAIPPAALATRLERFGVPRFIGALLGVIAVVGVLGAVSPATPARSDRRRARSSGAEARRPLCGRASERRRRGRGAASSRSAAPTARFAG